MKLTDKIFHDENAARAHMERLRWPEGPICPHCGNSDQEAIKRLDGESHRPGLFQCNACREHFTVTVGTVMERSHIPLHKWVLAFHLMNASKKGISAHQMHRMLAITYKSAWFMCHRIREAMGGPTTKGGMGGVGHQVEADETYYGNTSKRAKHYKKGHSQKSGVVALVNPGTGETRAFVVKPATSETIKNILWTNVHRGTTLVTDESPLYLQADYKRHEKVRHASAQYVNKDGYTTNNVENFFGVFKKGMVGTYHFCGEQHLQRYLNEFAFRYSNRSGIGIDDGERAAIAIRNASGKRLTYRPAN
ncbi:MAG TPA: IS1595 family transposase [Pseudolabrys sp.]|nr:IS1595 family transposase [Pseudolabrys sp.]